MLLRRKRSEEAYRPDEIDLLASRSATGEVETKTEFRQKLQLEAHQACSRTPGIEERVEQIGHSGMDIRMRIALRQEAAECGEMHHAV